MGKKSPSKLEANERLEEEDPGSEGDPSELGNEGKAGTGGRSCDGGDVSGGVTIERENEDLCLSEGRSSSFRKEGRMPVFSVIPLGRVCGRGPSEPLLFGRSGVAGFVMETGLEVDGLGEGTSFMDTFRVRRFGRVVDTFGCIL